MTGEDDPKLPLHTSLLTPAVLRGPQAIWLLDLGFCPSQCWRRFGLHWV